MNFTQSGAAVVNFTVASTPRVFHKQSGEWRDGEALFMRCSWWNRPAENVAESLTRGSRVLVHGRLRQRSFETKDGEKRTVVELVVDEMGSSLRYATVNGQFVLPATAKVNKASREGGGSVAPADDAWSSAPPSEEEVPF